MHSQTNRNTACRGTVAPFNLYTKCVGSPGIKTQPHARLPPSFLYMDACLTSQLNVALIRKLPGSLMCLNYYSMLLSMDVFTTRNRQTSGRLVQELNVCTVHVSDSEQSKRKSLHLHVQLHWGSKGSTNPSPIKTTRSSISLKLLM